MDETDHTQGQAEIGYRYYEGAAAGAVMIGDGSDFDAYAELFGWPEAVIEIQPDETNVMSEVAGCAQFARAGGLLWWFRICGDLLR
jgi:hypothetical protein